MLTLNTGVLQGYVLCPLLYSLFTHDCMATHVCLLTFADDTTVVGLITGYNESAYRDEGSDLAVWCQSNNLSFNVSKTKELIVTTGKEGASTPPSASIGLQWSRSRA